MDGHSGKPLYLSYMPRFFGTGAFFVSAKIHLLLWQKKCDTMFSARGGVCVRSFLKMVASIWANRHYSERGDA